MNAPATIATYSPRARSRPSRTASVRLPARRSVSRSRTLLTTRIARSQQPDGHGEHQRLPRERLGLGEVRAGHGHDAEEQEHEHLAEPLVAVGARPAGVEDAGQDRGRPDGQQLPAGGRDQVRARQHRDAERHGRRDQHLARRHQPAGGDAHRPEPVLRVGAAARVGVVVGEVRPHLDEQRADERGEEGERLERLLRRRQGGADQHGRHGRGQRPRPRGHQPDARRRWPVGDRHGRRGKREKSGGRFSR